MQQESPYPVYELVEAPPQHIKLTVHVLTIEDVEKVPVSNATDFATEGQATSYAQSGAATYYLTPFKAKNFRITKDAYVSFSDKVAGDEDYLGTASDILSFHKYSRKEKSSKPIKVYVNQDTNQVEKILTLVHARNQNIELCNGRGDEEGTPAFFEKLTRQFAQENNIEIVVIKGEDLLKEGFRLMHAVGRSSKNTSTFINLKYQGNPDSDSWVSFVGKGVCFDTGGLNIKPTSGIKDMYLDKCGAVSVFTAFQYVVKEKIKINLTVSMGYVENFVASNSYRPSDIIKSRKGLNVEIGNTDAEGRLVLADCMNWTQEHYKTEVLIELSTLTGAIIIALGSRFAGLFTNNNGLRDDLIHAGKQVHEESWHMPLDNYHRDLIKHKEADITNSSGKSEAGSSQAAAFLQNFVQKGTKWIHLDIAGTTIVASTGTGYGARLLIQYARNYASQ